MRLKSHSDFVIARACPKQSKHVELPNMGDCREASSLAMMRCFASLNMTMDNPPPAPPQGRGEGGAPPQGGGQCPAQIVFLTHCVQNNNPRKATNTVDCFASLAMTIARIFWDSATFDCHAFLRTLAMTIERQSIINKFQL